MEPTTTAALISGGAQILGGLLGRKKTDNAYNIALQEQSALRHEKASFDQKMELAKTHGLHPLAVLGAPMTTIAPAILPDHPADYSSVGAGVERIAQAAVQPPQGEAPQPSPTANQTRLEEATLRRVEADADAAQWRALLTQFDAEDRARSAGRVGLPPAAVVSNDAGTLRSLAASQAGVSPRMFSGGGVELEQKVTPPHPSILGHSLGADQGFQRMVDKDGHLFSMPNPNVYQPDIEQFGTFHYLSNKYGVDKAMSIMAALEQAPLAGGVLGTAGAAGYAAYKYFAKQREEALKRRMNPRVYIQPRPEPYRPQWRGRGND